MTRRILPPAALLLLSACGQSGPLYLPGNPSQVQAPPPPPEQPDEREDDEDDDEYR
jgi:predicted small lipoprotein YifL